MPSNCNGDTGEFLRLMADLEHDDPEQAPTYLSERMVLVGGVAWVTRETAEELEREAA